MSTGDVPHARASSPLALPCFYDRIFILLLKGCEFLEKTIKKERVLGLDILRTLAIVFVFITHAINIRGVLNVEQLSFKWTIYMIFRFLAMTCVPLFLILTGYLNNKKEISKKYYKGIIPLIFSYVVISIVEIIATAIYTKVPINVPLSIIQILNFSANGYAWYFEMYIGLFLLIPFLNILYDNLPDKKYKQILVGSLAFLTFLPQVAITFKACDMWLDVMPDYWQITYPLTYFFIGKCIREFQPKLKLSKRILLPILSLGFTCLCCYIFSTPDQYAWFTFNKFEALPTALTATFIFLAFYDFNKKIPVAQKIISEISICSFEMYLISSITDKMLYLILDYHMIIMVLITIALTYICAKLLILVRDFLLKSIMK